MTAVAFIVPCHGRAALTAVCLKALSRTCDHLRDLGVAAAAVVVADDENLATAQTFGMATIARDNRWLGAKINDGIQLAAAEGATHVIYLGSDNWLHPDWVWSALERSGPDVIVAMRQESVISPDGQTMIDIRVDYPGGPGVRLTPIGLYERLGWRPVGEERRKAIDGNTLDRLRDRRIRFRFDYHDIDPLQLVGFHSPTEQITAWDDLLTDLSVAQHPHPFRRLLDMWPRSLVIAAEAVYDARNPRKATQPA